MEDIQFVKLRDRDIEFLRQLNFVFSEAFEDPEKHLSNRPSDDYLQRLLSGDHFIALTAVSEGKVVGGIIAYVLQKYEQELSEVYLYDLAVAEAYRRRGIARRLILELKKIAQAIGACVIFVQAHREDAPAIALYRSMGAEEEPFHFNIQISDDSNSKSTELEV